MVHGSETLLIANRLEALGNETRLSIFHLLVSAGRKGLLVGQIQSDLAVPGSTLNHHLKRLMQVGLVSQEKQGREITCRAQYEAMNHVISFLTRNCCALERSGEMEEGAAA